MIRPFLDWKAPRVQGSLKFRLARDTSTASKRDWWLATSKAVQSIVVERMIATATVHNDKNAKRVYYLSLEFLMGRLFSNSLYNAGVIDDMVHALEELGLDYEELRQEEYDMGLGNGGLGRLAACFLDSLATLDLTSHRLRNPLPIRTLQAEIPQWLPGRTAGRMDAIRNALGNRPARANHGNSSLWLRRERLRRPGQLRPALDGLEKTGRHSL